MSLYGEGGNNTANETSSVRKYSRVRRYSRLVSANTHPRLNSYVLKTLLPAFISAFRLLGTRSTALASFPLTKWTGLKEPWILHTRLVGRNISLEKS
jgi:hypothetical protein